MRKVILFAASLFILGACSNDAEKVFNNATEMNEGVIDNADLNISIKRIKTCWFSATTKNSKM